MEWKLVPVEPTAEMITRGSVWAKYAEDAYKAMLDAAPIPPAQEDKPVAEIKLINGLPKVVAIVGYGDLIPGSLLYTRPDDKLRNRISQHLAIVHRDGGQHEETVGTEQTINDATNVIRKLRKAAEEALPMLEEAIDLYGCGEKGRRVVENLRAALEGK